MARPRSLDRSIEIKVFADVKALNAAMGNVNQSLGGIAGAAFRFQNAVGALTQVASLAEQIAAPLVDAAVAASNLDQAIGKSRAVFGEFSYAIEDFSRSTATALGVSSTAAIDAAGSIGNVFTSLGIAQEASANFGKEALQLAADMGAFANLPIEEALVALRSGLVGETEPLRRFGIVVYDAAVKAKALEAGLWDGTGAMDEGAKVMARWLLIQERSVNMTGSFNREIDTTQVQLQKLTAEFTDFQTSAGEDFVDPLTGAIKVVRGFVDVMKEVTDAKPANDAFGSALEGFFTGFTAIPRFVIDRGANLVGYFADQADAADRAALALANYNIRVGDLTAATGEADRVMLPYSRHLLDTWEANQRLADAVNKMRNAPATPWLQATAALEDYLTAVSGTTSELQKLLERLDDPTLRDTLVTIGDALRTDLVRELARSDDPEDKARLKTLIAAYAKEMLATGRTTFVPTGDRLIDEWVRAAFNQAADAAAIQRWLDRYQAYLNRNPLTPKLDVGDWYESLGGTRPSGTGKSGSVGGGPVINVYTGVGDPVQIGREVSRVLGAYTVRSGHA